MWQGEGMGFSLSYHLQFRMEKCVGRHHYACMISDYLKACIGIIG